MDSFAFVIHPIEPQRDVALKYPLLGRFPAAIIDYFSSFFPPVRLSHIVGICSEATGKEIEGWLIACPLTANRMTRVPISSAYNKIIQTGRLAERLGAQILGLGALTSVVGDAGVTVSRGLSIPVTTGNSYTVVVVVDALLMAAGRMGYDLERCTAAVVGAYGATGRACAQLLAQSISKLVLVGRQPAKLEEVKELVESAGAAAIIDTDVGAVRQADLVLTVTSAVRPIIEPEHLKPGAVVCDGARPRNVSRRVAEQRDDVLLIDGGVVSLPGEVDFGFDFGLAPGKAYACMAETALLALEGRYECYTLGRDIRIDRVNEIARLASLHGVRLSGFQSFERVLTDDRIARTREIAWLA
jgi:fatty aldehyde-generating acyl-ACP reductase